MILILLDNAFKYTPSSGRIQLQAYCEAEHALVEVVDSGVGISESDLPKIFDRFYRTDQARSGGDRGSGLGLSIAAWIAEMHSADISVQSTVGAGSVFRLADATTDRRGACRTHSRKHRCFSRGPIISRLSESPFSPFLNAC